MKKTISLQYLYCLDKLCQLSVYHRMVALRLPFNGKSLSGEYRCSCCNQPLISAMDMAIRNFPTIASIETPQQTKFLDN